ncbi:unnamed protein product [Caenorhabditis auriculariae]|uniref:Peptidylprolyl isomerase n=1 Tax=Caenorhabditis auriculariae TaxID=2777116 RepID=A0A8S1HQR2_9PELO|nr:unnamed protein product [Caenorhabditis auriculariae]
MIKIRLLLFGAILFASAMARPEVDFDKFKDINEKVLQTLDRGSCGEKAEVGDHLYVDYTIYDRAGKELRSGKELRPKDVEEDGPVGICVGGWIVFAFPGEDKVYLYEITSIETKDGKKKKGNAHSFILFAFAVAFFAFYDSYRFLE